MPVDSAGGNEDDASLLSALARLRRGILDKAKEQGLILAAYQNIEGVFVGICLGDLARVRSPCAMDHMSSGQSCSWHLPPWTLSLPDRNIAATRVASQFQRFYLRDRLQYRISGFLLRPDWAPSAA